MSPDDEAPTQPSGDLVRQWWVLAALTLILACAALVRIRLIDLPLERDEGEYAYAGQLMLQGIPPYQLAYNMKLPGTYAAYALIMAAFGETTRGIHLGLILINSLTIVLTYLLGRRLFGQICGLTAAGCFALLSLTPSVLGLAAHATHLVALFGTAGALLLSHSQEKESRSLIFWSGLCMGMAFVMKQQGIFYSAFGAFILLDREWRRLPRALSRGFSHLSIFAVGVLSPLALVCAILAYAGVFSRFWFWTVSYASQYAAITPIARGWVNLQHGLFSLIAAAPGIWVLAAFGSLLVLYREEDRRKTFFIASFAVASFATTCPGLYFREHYFIPLLPSIGILVGAGIRIVFREIERRPWNRAWVIAPVVVVMAASAQAVFRHRVLFFQLSPSVATRAIYQENPFPEAVEIARYIREHSAPGSQIAILGSEPEIYFYSRRHSATGYIYTYPLMEPHAYALTMQQEMIAQIEAAKPEFVVLVDVAKSWLARPTSNPFILQWFEKYSAAHLRTVGFVEIQPDQTIYRWDEKAVAVTPRSKSYVRVFKRSDLF